jgi:hypothetical protein
MDDEDQKIMGAREKLKKRLGKNVKVGGKHGSRRAKKVAAKGNANEDKKLKQQLN